MHNLRVHKSLLILTICILNRLDRLGNMREGEKGTPSLTDIQCTAMLIATLLFQLSLRLLPQYFFFFFFLIT